MAVAVHATAIHKHYRSPAGPLPVLRGLDLAVERGATAAITGESGSGKSTLLNIVAGLDHLGRAGYTLAASTWPSSTRRSWRAIGAPWAWCSSFTICCATSACWTIC